MNALPLATDGRTGREPPSAGEVAGYVVATAVWAPSVHNTQPWWFSADEQEISLHPDQDRRLRVADPDGRQMMISCGAALFTTRLALRSPGYVPRTSVLPDPGEPTLVAQERAGRQARWHELTKSQCFELLAAQQLGRVAVVDDRGPIVLPVNFVLDRHMVVFRTDEGTKLDAASCGARVAFEVDGIDAATRTGWSVVVRGEIAEVTDPAELARLRELPLYPWAPGARSRYVRILPASLTGRRVLVPDGMLSS